jgi:hypothetical protein
MCNTAFLQATTGVLLCHYSVPAMGLCVSHCVAVLRHAHTALIRHAQCYESEINMQKRDERSSPAETALPHALHCTFLCSQATGICC